jgi:DNA-binding NarL/FixJ family response regulator
MGKIRVLIVEDQTTVREGFAAILNLADDIEVVGQAGDGYQAISKVKQTNPEVILLDLGMPRMDGLSTIPKVIDIAPDMRILVLTSYPDGDRAFQAIKSGAAGYMLKDVTGEQLIQAIRDVYEDRPTIHPSIAMKLIRELNGPANEMLSNALTNREMETLHLITRGLSNQEIAVELCVHERTVAKYVSSILNKLHVSNRTQAALYAMDQGLVEKPFKKDVSFGYKSKVASNVA